MIRHVTCLSLAECIIQFGLKIKSTLFCHYSALQKSHGGGNLGNNIFFKLAFRAKLSDPEISTISIMVNSRSSKILLRGLRCNVLSFNQ
jgi:hypothetical protein